VPGQDSFSILDRTEWPQLPSSPAVGANSKQCALHESAGLQPVAWGAACSSPRC
jgi:hypothetical protein